MDYSIENEDYLMTTPYTKKIQAKFKEAKSFLQSNGFKASPDGLLQDIVSTYDNRGD